MKSLVLLSLLFFTSFVFADHENSEDDDDSVVEGRDNMQRPWKIYTDSSHGAGLSSSDSTFKHLEHEPYFVARYNGRRIKKCKFVLCLLLVIFVEKSVFVVFSLLTMSFFH